MGRTQRPCWAKGKTPGHELALVNGTTSHPGPNHRLEKAATAVTTGTPGPGLTGFGASGSVPAGPAFHVLGRRE